MTELQIKIDWLTLTKRISSREIEGRVNKGKALAKLIEEAQRVGVDASEFEVVRGDGFYAIHVLFNRDHVRGSCDLDLEKQGIRLVYSGKALAGETKGVRVLASAVENDWRPTRIDVAIDVLNSGVTVEDVFHAYDEVHGGNKQRSVNFKKTARGDTLYIGSRHSEKMLRVYDKAAEQGLANDWVRYEVEAKGQAAIQLVPKILASLRSVGMVHVAMLSLPSFPLAKAIEEFSFGEPIGFERVLPTKDGRDKWLQGVVAPNLGKMKHDHPEEFAALMDYIEQLAKAHQLSLF